MVVETHLQYSTLADILKDLTQGGDFSIAVLTDRNGLPIASSDGDQVTSEAQSAVVAQIQNVVIRALGNISMSTPDEISLNDVDGRKLVCRQFSGGDGAVYLAVVMPNRSKPYRKAMNRAIRLVQQVWNI
jgi:predicted regulator of Ras-like GTPase activity (Roadblock/LC7/MglB family)